jgi:hypothetical protein
MTGTKLPLKWGLRERLAARLSAVPTTPKNCIWLLKIATRIEAPLSPAAGGIKNVANLRYKRNPGLTTFVPVLLLFQQCTPSKSLLGEVKYHDD